MKKSTTHRTHRSIEVRWREVVAMGIDLGDRYSQFVALDGSGEQIGDGRIPTTAEAFQVRFGSIGPKAIAIETGTHSPWVSRLLSSMGHQVTIANSRKLRLIYENRRKNDKVDADYLGRLVRLDPKLLKPVQHRTVKAQQHVTMLRARDAAVRTRTRLITFVRGVIKSTGKRVPSCSAEGFVKQAKPIVAEVAEQALQPILTTIESINAVIKNYDKSIEGLAKSVYPDAKVLTQITGVGLLTAIAYMVTIENPARFHRSRTVGAWLGLVPGQNGSGQSDPQQRITKEGDQYLRRLLVSCAQYILGRFGPDCDLRRHGMAIAARGGKNAKKRAVVAVARKVAVLLHRLWSTQAVYEPLRNHGSADQAA